MFSAKRSASVLGEKVGISGLQAESEVKSSAVRFGGFIITTFYRNVILWVKQEGRKEAENKTEQMYKTEELWE